MFKLILYSNLEKHFFTLNDLWEEVINIIKNDIDLLFISLWNNIFFYEKLINLKLEVESILENKEVNNYTRIFSDEISYILESLDCIYSKNQDKKIKKLILNIKIIQKKILNVKNKRKTTLELVDEIASWEDLMNFYINKSSNISNSKNEDFFKKLLKKFTEFFSEIEFTKVNLNRLLKIKLLLKNNFEDNSDLFYKLIDNRKILNKLIEITNILWENNVLEKYKNTIQEKINFFLKKNQISDEELLSFRRMCFVYNFEDEPFKKWWKFNRQLARIYKRKIHSKNRNISKSEKKAIDFIVNNYNIKVKFWQYKKWIELDIFIWSKNLNIEIDWEHHKRKIKKDEKRDNALSTIWIKVIRIKNLKNIEEELEEILENFGFKKPTKVKNRKKSLLKNKNIEIIDNIRTIKELNWFIYNLRKNLKKTDFIILERIIIKTIELLDSWEIITNFYIKNYKSIIKILGLKSEDKQLIFWYKEKLWI